VLRGSQYCEQIEVYRADYHLLFLIDFLPRLLGAVGDIVVCEHNRCIYISDRSQELVHKLVLSDAEATQWPVHDAPSCLSLTVTHSVLVTCPVVCKIKEFSQYRRSTTA